MVLNMTCCTHGLSNFVVNNFCLQTSEFLHSLSLSPFGGNQNFNFMATMLQLKVTKRQLFEKNWTWCPVLKHRFEKQCATDHWWRSFPVTMDGHRKLFVKHQAQHLVLFFFLFPKFVDFFACIKGVSMSFSWKRTSLFLLVWLSKWNRAETWCGNSGFFKI